MAKTDVADVRDTVLQAQMNDECPFEKLVELINPQRKLDQNPLYSVETGTSGAYLAPGDSPQALGMGLIASF